MDTIQHIYLQACIWRLVGQWTGVTSHRALNFTMSQAGILSFSQWYPRPSPSLVPPPTPIHIALWWLSFRMTISGPYRSLYHNENGSSEWSPQEDQQRWKMKPRADCDTPDWPAKRTDADVKMKQNKNVSQTFAGLGWPGLKAITK